MKYFHRKSRLHQGSRSQECNVAKKIEFSFETLNVSQIWHFKRRIAKGNAGSPVTLAFFDVLREISATKERPLSSFSLRESRTR